MMRYAWIQNRNTGQIVKWEPWQYQLDLLDLFLTCNELVILKARQLGVSWLGAGYCLWAVLFQESAKVLFLSQGEKEAWDMVSKARFIWSHLPKFLRIDINHDTKSFIDFRANDCEISALPSTDKAGRSTDATIVWRDEAANHPYGEENFASIGPTIDAGGQLIDCGTILKLDANNHFTQRIVAARSGDSNAHFKFLGWRLRPVRQEGMTLDEWFDLRIKPKYTAFQIEQEYPETVDDALRPTKVRAFYDVDALEQMLMYVQQPLQGVADINSRNGIISIFKLPMVGEKYCIFTDPSDGKDDPHATIVFHPRTGEEMANSHGKVPADECAKIHDELVRFYNNAYNSYEVNATAGGKFAQTIELLDTPNRHAFRKGLPVENNPGQHGWWTSGQTKKDMRDGLEEATRRHLIIMHDRRAIEELREIIRPEGDEPQARFGGHDDFETAWGGGWQIKRYMPLSTGIRIKSSFYRTN